MYEKFIIWINQTNSTQVDLKLLFSNSWSNPMVEGLKVHKYKIGTIVYNTQFIIIIIVVFSWYSIVIKQFA